MSEHPRLRPGQERPPWAAPEPPEIWRKVPAYRLLGVPSGYEASSEGRVRSPRQVLTQRPDDDLYPTVTVGGKRVRVAILVLLAFQGRPEVLHLDDVRGNNRPGNLAWGSRLVNERMKGKRGREEERDGIGYCPPFSTVVPVTPITLSGAIALGLVSGTMGALKVARHRDSLFPHPVGKDGRAYLYEPQELVSWDRARGGHLGY